MALQETKYVYIQLVLTSVKCVTYLTASLGYKWS